MVRIARVVAPGFPHHITQRGNRRQETFFNDEDYQAYRELLSEWSSLCNGEVWALLLDILAEASQRFVFFGKPYLEASEISHKRQQPSEGKA